MAAIWLYTLIDIVGYLFSIVVPLVIVQVILSLLLQFNVINAQSDFVAAIWRSVNALLDPILTPVRRIMPNTGAIDFSPMVFLMILNALGYILQGAVR